MSAQTRWTTRLSVGLAAGHPMRLAAHLIELEEAGVDTLHLDIFDGRFAGPLAGGSNLAAAVSDRFACDVHLMVEEPERHIDAVVRARPWAITVHPETTAQPHRLLRDLADADVVRGVALTPSQPIAILEPLLDQVDLVLVLGVDPGRRHPMAPGTEARVAAVRELTAGAGTLVGIDGGVTDSTLDRIAALHCDVVVAGSAVFGGPGGPGATARRFLERLGRVAA